MFNNEQSVLKKGMSMASTTSPVSIIWNKWIKHFIFKYDHISEVTKRIFFILQNNKMAQFKQKFSKIDFFCSFFVNLTMIKLKIFKNRFFKSEIVEWPLKVEKSLTSKIMEVYWDILKTF